MNRAILLIASVLFISFLGGEAALGADTPDAWPAVRVNEWMAYNTGVVRDPFDNDYDDWFELYNPTASAVDLTGWSVSDDTNQPARFVVPAGHIIPPFGYLLVWADSEPEQNSTNSPYLHVNFSLEKNGECILLSAPDGSLVDSVVFDAQYVNNSEGRYPDGGATIVRQIRPTPNAENLGDYRLPGIESISRSSDRITLVITSAIPSFLYRLQYKNGLSATNWITGDFHRSFSTSFGFTDMAGTNSQRFYRILWDDESED